MRTDEDHTFVFLKRVLLIEFGMSFYVLLYDFEVFWSEFEGYLCAAWFFVFIRVWDDNSHIAAVSSELKHVGDIGFVWLRQNPI